jgi:hypothetical protein
MAPQSLVHTCRATHRTAQTHSQETTWDMVEGSRDTKGHKGHLTFGSGYTWQFGVTCCRVLVRFIFSWPLPLRGSTRCTVYHPIALHDNTRLYQALQPLLNIPDSLTCMCDVHIMVGDD